MKIPFFSSRKNVAALTVEAPAAQKIEDPVDCILHYHEVTKHHYHRFARSLGYLDWDTQPDPFRRFEGAPLIRLALLPQSSVPYYDAIFQNLAPAEVSFTSISRFFRNSLAVSAWKRYQDAHWALRVNPSSGNLHPTEGYLIIGNAVPELEAGLYHYAPQEHGLELRARSSSFPGVTFFVGLSSIHWREAWKYGERAFRYCQHDIGHAIAAIRISAAILGWKVTLLDHLSDDQISMLLGLNRPEDFQEAEDEHPAALLAITPNDAYEDISTAIDRFCSEAKWYGHANRLSESHVEWDIIDRAAAACWKPPTGQGIRKVDDIVSTTNDRRISAEGIIQQRRSCLALDGITSIDSKTFFRMMERALPGLNLMSTPRIHLALFVHRVNGLDPGLYILVRDSAKVQQLKEAMYPDSLWIKPKECPEQLELFLLKTADVTRIATSVSCGQDIAGDGAFSLGMIAEFEESIREKGAWFYRRLFWETGIIGQILYLEAEAAGIRSTGIGCFFDDPVHETFGFRDRKFQSLYHFTAGGPVEDTRLTTEAAYTRE